MSLIGSIKRFAHQNNPRRLKNDADRATKLAMRFKSKDSVRRALNLKAAREAEKVADPTDKMDRIHKAINPKARTQVGGWSSGTMSYYSDVADRLKEGVK
jgi:hypothetical protein